MLQHADELSLLQAQIAYKKRLESVMRELTSQEAGLQERTAKLEVLMRDEQKDVERLEKHSLAGFFYHLTGQMDAVMDRERREAYAARVKYDTVIRELEAVREDICETRQDLEDLADCEERYARALEERRHALESAEDPRGTVLLEKEQKAGYLAQQEQELEEAITCGTSALRTMAQLQQNLHGAKDWASDSRSPLFWADRARQEKLEEAQQCVELLQVQMQRFNKELSDVTIRPNLKPSIDRMLAFADLLFDDLLEDMAVAERIRHSCQLADQTREHILGVLRQLQNTLEEVRHNHKRIRQEMDTIVLQTIDE